MGLPQAQLSQPPERIDELPSRADIVRELVRFLSQAHHLIFVALVVYVLCPSATFAVGIGLMFFALLNSSSENRDVYLDQSPDRT